MNEKILFIFITGIGIGFILNILFTEKPIATNGVLQLKNAINESNTITTVKKIRILCFLATMPESHSRKAIHIQNTWGKHCDKLLFASTIADENLDALAFNVTESHALWAKVKVMFQHIYRNYLNEYDWFYKGDDDSFMIPENLKFLLASYSPDDPIYFGYKYNTSDHKWGYFSGGSGYVLSRKDVRIFVEQLLTNKSLCPIDEENVAEDWTISECLDNGNVYAGDSRDLLRRERFFPFQPSQHLFPYRGKYWYWERKYYNNDDGLDCCSNYTIAFHYIPAKYMYHLYYLTYIHRVFGTKHHFPPLQKKRNFQQVVEILNLERFNSSYRGYK
ncbi:glycoprotein-N-acetylgalactosamine 3-beta-galactosyltransferase 1-like [Contarinia nasturtii]|uniref:glycoprotein-N-acetylgalactosamine 3-beta-galactosyltransferase 1-like n=1 Tax=Contarinia nasturtii TaxID=265458 RepID=UPI0012D3B829|nr:glycoprotein-N-acetylgalactosamine 3-beta-galactosyltransferase 1-like [Contarinia nasturtii]